MKILDDVFDERDKQDDQWGVQNHHPAYWLAILGKQMGQMGTAILNREWWHDKDKASADLRHECIQLVAVGIAMLECLDRGKMPIGLTTMPQGRQRAHALGLGDEQINYDEVPSDLDSNGQGTL
jgi:hypothetical protein